MKSVIELFQDATATKSLDSCYHAIAAWLEELKPGSMNYLLLPPRLGLSTMLQSYVRWFGEGRATMYSLTKKIPNNLHGMSTPELLVLDNATMLDKTLVDKALDSLSSSSTIHVIAGHDISAVLPGNIRAHSMKTLMHRAPATDYFILPAIVLPDPLYYRKVAHLRVEQSCCPSRYSLENYKHTRNNMGYSAFNIQYQHEPFLQAVKHG